MPFNIAGQLDLDVVLKASARARAQFGVGATSSATARAGITFRNGRWEGATSRNWAFNRISPSISAGSNADLALSLVPSVSLIAAWIGGPTCSFVPYVAANIQAGGGGCNADVGWGVEVQVGARVDVC